MLETEIKRFFTLLFFKKLTDIPPLNCKIHREIFKKFCKDLPTMVAQQKPVSSFYEYILLKKIKIGRKTQADNG